MNDNNNSFTPIKLIKEAFGPSANLYTDVLRVSKRATTQELQIAFTKRRSELYDELKTSTSSSPEFSTPTKMMTKQKLDAVMATYRLLSDAKKRLMYDELLSNNITTGSVEKKEQRRPSPTDVIAIFDEFKMSDNNQISDNKVKRRLFTDTNMGGNQTKQNHHLVQKRLFEKETDENNIPNTTITRHNPSPVSKASTKSLSSTTSSDSDAVSDTNTNSSNQEPTKPIKRWGHSSSNNKSNDRSNDIPSRNLNLTSFQDETTKNHDNGQRPKSTREKIICTSNDSRPPIDSNLDSDVVASRKALHDKFRQRSRSELSNTKDTKQRKNVSWSEDVRSNCDDDDDQTLETVSTLTSNNENVNSSNALTIFDDFCAGTLVKEMEEEMHYTLSSLWDSIDQVVHAFKIQKNDIDALFDTIESASEDLHGINTTERF